MASEDRIKQLYQEQLGRPANPTQSLADSGVSSVDAVAFIKVVGDEFNVTIPAEEVAKFSNLGDLIAYVDSHSG